MNILEVYSAANSHITSAIEYDWQCFGSDAKLLQIVDDNGPVGNCVFDATTGEVFAVELVDVANSYACRWISKEYASAFVKECTANLVNPDIAFDGCRFQTISASDMLIRINQVTGLTTPIHGEDNATE